MNHANVQPCGIIDALLPGHRRPTAWRVGRITPHGLILMARWFEAHWNFSPVLLLTLAGTTGALVDVMLAAPPARYSARFSNGERFEGDDDYDAPGTRATLGWVWLPAGPLGG